MGIAANASSVRLPVEKRGAFLPSFSDVAFLLPILVLFWCTTGVGWLLTDSDTGWHIRAGEWILKYGRVPATDIFSFTKPGELWYAWEWLSDVGMAVAHRYLGLAGIVLVSLLVLGCTSACLYRNTAAESEHRLVAIGLTGIAMSASTIHWLARPHLVTPLFAAGFCWLLNESERRRKPALVWALPPLTAVWVNLHGGFFVGIALLITYAIGAVAEELLRGANLCAWLRARKYVWAAVACALASLANPYGYHLHVHVAQYLGTSFYLERISEFQSVDFHPFSAAYFETLLVVAIAAAAWHLFFGRLIQAVLLLSWSHLALLSTRNIPIFAVVVLPGIGSAMRDWLACARSRQRLMWLKGPAVAIAELETGLQILADRQRGRRWHLLPSVAVMVLATLLAHPGRLKALRAEFDRNRFPADAATFLSQEGCGQSTRLYASWQWGGYLIYRLWPSITVFDDGRTDFYGPAFVEEGLLAWNASPRWHDILERYQVNAALLPVDSALATVLRERPEWKPIYQDHIAVLFAKVEKGR